MSFTNIHADGTLTRLERVLRRQRRLRLWSLLAMSALGSGMVFVAVSGM